MPRPLPSPPPKHFQISTRNFPDNNKSWTFMPKQQSKNFPHRVNCCLNLPALLSTVLPPNQKKGSKANARPVSAPLHRASGLIPQIRAWSLTFPPLLVVIKYNYNSRDTISSHDKKRHYLECLEAYVVFLHEQLTLVGAEPLPLERVSSYRGLSSRSIRVSSLPLPP